MNKEFGLERAASSAARTGEVKEHDPNEYDVGSPAPRPERFTNLNAIRVKNKGGINMQSLLQTKKLVAILVVGGFVLFLGILPALAQTDTAAKMKLIQGVDQMMAGKKMLITALHKQMLEKDPKLAEGIKKLNEGEQMAMKGENLMNKKAENRKIKGKEEIMNATSKMMEGKDLIMNELKARGMMQEGNLKEAEVDLRQGENTIMDGKNMMMDGFKDITWD